MTAALDLLDFSRSGGGTVWGPDGRLITVDADVLRQAYHPLTGKLLGSMVEKGTSNLLSYSEEHDQWSQPPGATVTPNSADAPDGEATADTITKTATTHRRILNGFAATAGQVYTGSTHLKAGSLDMGTILLDGQDGTSGADARVVFDFANKSMANVGSTGLIASWMDELPDGWWRCGVAGLLDTNTNPTMSIYPGYYSQGTAGDILAWGSMVEPGDVMTSYTRSGSGPAARAGDVLTLSYAKRRWPQNGPTVALESIIPRLPSSGFPGLLRFEDSANSTKRVGCYYNVTNGSFSLASRPDGVTKDGFAAVNLTPVAGLSFRIAARLAKDNIALAANGTLSAADTTANISVTDVLRLCIFDSQFPSLLLRDFVLLPYPAGDAELADLSIPGVSP